MNELIKILAGFFKDNKLLVMSSVGLQIIYSILETIIIPTILAGAFNNINTPEKFGSQLILLIGNIFLSTNFHGVLTF